MKSLLVFLLVLALFCVAVVLQAQTHGTLQGTVTDIDGTPVPGATVHILGTDDSTTANSDGSFVLNRLRPKNYNVQISAMAMLPVEQEVYVPKGATATLDIKLEMECGARIRIDRVRTQNAPQQPATNPNTPGSLNGRVYDSDGAPLAAARIEVVGTSRGALSKYDGSYFIANVRPGTHTIKVALLGKEAVETEVTITPGTVLNVDFTLSDEEGISLEAVMIRSAPIQRIEPNVTGKTTLTDEGSVVTDVPAILLRESTVNTVEGSSNGYGIRGGRANEAVIRRDGYEISDFQPLPTVPLHREYELGYHSRTAIEPGTYSGKDGDQITTDDPLSTSTQGLYENTFRATESSPYSTFSIDVDNASYTNIRGYLSRGEAPPASAVRIEELINYFNYEYPQPTGEHPFAFHSEVTTCPWASEHLILRLALQGRELHPEQAPPANLVFLIDVSGSMSSANKLALLKKGFVKLVDQLRPEDRVAIVVYAGAAGLVLKPTSGQYKATIKCALSKLKSGGSTAGGAGIQLAYKVARENFLPDGTNRVILATDGDFNVGVSSQSGLVGLIEEERKSGVFLSVLGFGTGNYQDQKMEQLADNGNGNYYYIDKLTEAERVLVTEMSGTLNTIAKDVKLQIKFNPTNVAAYRLIGYENRVLAARDFDDDTKDAGELGAGHQVTALYEIVPVGAEIGYDVDHSKGEDYQLDEKRPELLSTNDLLLARLRYKEPSDSTSKLIEHIVHNTRVPLEHASKQTRFAMSVAQWGMLLRKSSYAGTGTFTTTEALASQASGTTPDSYRKEFIGLVQRAKTLQKK